MVVYRCVKSNTSNEVLAIGIDENQAGRNYNDVGIWQNFTFTAIPTIIPEVLTYVQEHDYMGNLHKVVSNTIVSKELTDFE